MSDGQNFSYSIWAWNISWTSSQYEHEISAELLPNKVIDSFFSSEYNFVSAQGKYHRTYYLNKCRMDIYPALNFMWKWARSKRGFFLSFCTTLMIVMYALFKINAIVSECTGVHSFFIMFILHIYSTSVNLQTTPTAGSIGAESQGFHFWTSESLGFWKSVTSYTKKNFLMKILILLKHDLHWINPQFF